MSTAACPNGHLSADPEWCDTCGAKIGAAVDPAVAQETPMAEVAEVVPDVVGGSTQPCPHCSTANAVDNLFCEQCGYDFTTGQTPPEPAPAAPPAPVEELAADAPQWVVIVEIDPEWYALKGALADQPCPPASSASVTLHYRTSLIGRVSQSLGVRPEIGLDTDTGVSRRHAQILCDGDTVAVVDLSSTNGTYVVTGEGNQPDEDTPALDPGVATELHDGDRVYVGAWSRLTLRRG